MASLMTNTTLESFLMTLRKDLIIGIGMTLIPIMSVHKLELLTSANIYGVKQRDLSQTSVTLLVIAGQSYHQLLRRNLILIVIWLKALMGSTTETWTLTLITTTSLQSSPWYKFHYLQTLL